MGKNKGFDRSWPDVSPMGVLLKAAILVFILLVMCTTFERVNVLVFILAVPYTTFERVNVYVSVILNHLLFKVHFSDFISYVKCFLIEES